MTPSRSTSSGPHAALRQAKWGDRVGISAFLLFLPENINVCLMLAFISCAKTMAARCTLRVPQLTTPCFEAEALQNALSLSQYSAAELETLLRVNAKIAAENRLRYHDFCSEENRPMPAIGAYTGAVFKRIAPRDFNSAA